MMKKNSRLITFARPQMKISEPINNKKKSLSPKSPKIRQPQEKLRSKSKDRMKLDHSGDKNNMQNHIILQQQAVNFRQIPQQRDTISKNNENVITFNKDLLQLHIPDAFENYKFIKKIENRVISCLQKKKPHFAYKKLVSPEIQKDILGENERKIMTKSDHNIEKYQTQPQSMKKMSSMKQINQHEMKIDFKKMQSLNPNIFCINIPPIQSPKVPNLFNQQPCIFFNQSDSSDDQTSFQSILQASLFNPQLINQEIPKVHQIKANNYIRTHYHANKDNFPLPYNNFEEKQSSFYYPENKYPEKKYPQKNYPEKNYQEKKYPDKKYLQNKQQLYYQQNPFHNKFHIENRRETDMKFQLGNPFQSKNLIQNNKKQKDRDLRFDLRNIRVPKVQSNPGKGYYPRNFSNSNNSGNIFPIIEQEPSKLFQYE